MCNTIIGGPKWYYISVCIVKMYDILKVKAFSTSVYFIIEYTICIFFCAVFDNQYVCFYFLNISVGMENEKAVFLLCILALLYKSHQIDGHCCEIMISWRVQKRRQYKKTKLFLLPPIILLLSLLLSSSLLLSYSFSCQCLFPHLHFLQLFSLFIFVILVSLQLLLS
jgi:hypothetical protein